MILDYQLSDGSTTLFEPSENYISYPTYLEKVASNEYHRLDPMGNRIIYKLNDLEDATDDKVWYRSYLGNTITDSSTGIDVEIIHLDANNPQSYIKQIKTAQTLVDIDDSDLTRERYTMHFYKAEDADVKDANGRYTLKAGASPFASWEVQNPTYGQVEYAEASITKTIYTSEGSVAYPIITITMTTTVGSW